MRIQYPPRRIARPGGILLAVLLALPVPIASAVITVGGDCTLVAAMTAANSDAPTGSCPAGSGADEIRLTEDVTLTAVDNNTDGPNALPSVTNEITIVGSGFKIERSTDPGTPDFRIFHVASTGTLMLNGVTVSNGYLNPALIGQRGGGIFNSAGTLVLTNSGMSGNRANSGGGIYQDSGSTSLTDSTMFGNSATSNGGGIYQDDGVVALTDSTLFANSALTGAGISNLGGEVIITSSTLSGNSARYGGGIHNYIGTVTLTNSTLSGNSADVVGGAILTSLATVTLTNTIVANSPSGDNCAGGVINAGNNLADETTCGTIPGTLTGLETLLLDNGGPTMTHALLAGSNALDAGSMPDCPVTDQRGAPRVSTCDIGAFEFFACPDLVLSSEVVSGTETRENCQAIVAGPDFSVDATGDLTLRAGIVIALGDATSVDASGQLALEVERDLQLTPPSFPRATFNCVIADLATREVECNHTGRTICPPNAFSWTSTSVEDPLPAPEQTFAGSDIVAVTFNFLQAKPYRIRLELSDQCGTAAPFEIQIDDFDP